MTFETRLSLLTFNGVQAFPGMEPLYLFTDADRLHVFYCSGADRGAGAGRVSTALGGLSGEPAETPAPREGARVA